MHNLKTINVAHSPDADDIFMYAAVKFGWVSSKNLAFTSKALDKAGFKHVKIVVSSGFNPQKMSEFEKFNTPVDIYGVGSYLVKNDICGFTGDLVELNGKSEAKFGRKNFASDRLKRVKF